MPFEPPTQARSRAALERLIAAGEDLLAVHAFETTKVADIAARARSSVGTFYRVVGDREQLLCLIHDRFMVDSQALLEERLDPAHFVGRPLSTVVRAFVGLLVEVYTGREGLLRALIVRSSADPAFRARVHALNRHVAAALHALVTPRAKEVGHPQGAAMFAFGTEVVLGALNHQTLVGGSLRDDPAALRAELSRVLLTYLGVRDDEEGT